MNLRAAGIGVLLLAVGLTAAAQESPYEQTLQKMIGALDKIGEELKKIVDEQSAAAARPELKTQASAWLDAKTKAEKLQPPEKDEKLRLEKAYRPKLEKALQTVNLERRRVASVPGGKDALQEIAGIFERPSKK